MQLFFAGCNLFWKRKDGNHSKQGAILHNEAEVFSLSITNPKGRPMLQFDWLIHSGLILARYHKILESDGCFILQANIAFWIGWTRIAQREELTKKNDVFNLNFIILFLHLRKPSCSLKFSSFDAIVSFLLRGLRWLITNSSTFQDEDFNGSLLPVFITWCYRHGIKKLPNHRWTRWYHFRDTIGYHSNTMTC